MKHRVVETPYYVDAEATAVIATLWREAAGYGARFFVGAADSRSLFGATDSRSFLCASD